VECFEEKLKVRSLEMLAYRAMEKPNLSFAQECLNDRVPSQLSTSLFIDGMGVHRMP